MSGLSFRSFKLRLADRHVRAVPATDAEGCAFGGPGVDLRGAEADAVFLAAAPLLEALLAVEPGVLVRSLAVDLERPRVTATLETSAGSDERPRAVRIDGGALLDELVARSAAVLASLAGPVAEALANRSRSA